MYEKIKITIKVKWTFSTQIRKYLSLEYLTYGTPSNTIINSRKYFCNLEKYPKSKRGLTVLAQSVTHVLEDFAYKVNSVSDISCIWFHYQSKWIQQHLRSWFWAVPWFMDAHGYSMERVCSEETMVKNHKPYLQSRVLKIL